MHRIGPMDHPFGWSFMITKKDTSSRLSSFFKEYRAEIKFVAIFGFGLVFFFLLINNRFVAEHVVMPVTVAETYVASQALELIGFPNTQQGNVLIGKGGNTWRMEVRNNCNGVYESIVFLMAFVAIQIPWRRKIGWMLFGFFLFHVVNEMRLVSLFIIGSGYSNETFVFFHETFWQYALVIVTLGIFLFCAYQVGKTKVVKSEEASHAQG